MSLVQTYVIGSRHPALVKIGRSTNVAKRLIGLQTASPVELQLIHRLPGDLEAHLHGHFRPCRAHGEWFYINDIFTHLMYLTIHDIGQRKILDFYQTKRPDPRVVNARLVEMMKDVA